jgi:hypothetical protein
MREAGDRLTVIQPKPRHLKRSRLLKGKNMADAPGERQKEPWTKRSG